MEQEIKNGTYTIPEGFTAKIEDGKIVVEKKKSEGVRISEEIIEHIKDQIDSFISAPDCRDKYEEEELARYKKWIAYLEKQKDAEIEIEKAYKNADEIQYKKGFEDGVASVKPAEWGEEDEKRLNHILSLIKIDKEQEQKFIAFCGLNDLQERDKDVSWLKSLRPKPHWKPSEEQIYSLGTVVKGYDNRTVGSVGYNLKELYADLKKL